MYSVPWPGVRGSLSRRRGGTWPPDEWHHQTSGCSYTWWWRGRSASQRKRAYTHKHRNTTESLVLKCRKSRKGAFKNNIMERKDSRVTNLGTKEQPAIIQYSLWDKDKTPAAATDETNWCELSDLHFTSRPPWICLLSPSPELCSCTESWLRPRSCTSLPTADRPNDSLIKNTRLFVCL